MDDDEDVSFLWVSCCLLLQFRIPALSFILLKRSGVLPLVKCTPSDLTSINPLTILPFFSSKFSEYLAKSMFSGRHILLTFCMPWVDLILFHSVPRADVYFLTWNNRILWSWHLCVEQTIGTPLTTMLSNSKSTYAPAFQYLRETSDRLLRKLGQT
jgi:hypothetical protein